MWKTEAEADAFLKAVNRRTRTVLLLETKEAVDCVDAVLDHPLLDGIHIGLNDLHLSYGQTFMFELLADGTVEKLCKKFRSKGIIYGFGGIARIGEGTLPAERIVMEHYRLGSSLVILSRSFCDANAIADKALIERVFVENIASLREYEKTLANKAEFEYSENIKIVKNCVDAIVARIKEKMRNG
jgi:hypothetical protein